GGVPRHHERRRRSLSSGRTGRRRRGHGRRRAPPALDRSLVLSLQSTNARWPCQHVRSRPALRREHRPVRSGSHSLVGGGHPRQLTALKGLPVVDLGPARAARFDRRTPARLGEFHPQAPKIRKGGQAPCRRVARLWFVKTETRSYYEAAVERAVARIVRSLDEALDLSVLAREAALSTFHFQRVFRGMLGETPIEMHRRLRLERAAAQLIEQDLAVTTIAFAAGYETHEGFTRAFRQAYGGSPSSFRQPASGLGIGCSRPPAIQLAAPSGVHYRSQHLTIRFAGGESAMDVTIEDMPELRVAAVRHLGPYSRISEAFARLGALA